MRGVDMDVGRARRAWGQRRALVLALAVVFAVLFAARDASAYTLTLTFPDGEPMTYGSACGGAGCLARGDDLRPTNAAGEVVLAGRPRAVEYRRDGIALLQAPPGAAAGRLAATGDRDSVLLPRLLAGAAPATDAAEFDLVARVNEARDADGLPLAQLNDRLAASADLQAAWLARNAITWSQPQLMHIGPFATTLAFRHAEVSLPDPGVGSEVAEVGGSSAEALADWMASPPHRASLLQPGPLLIGAARAGSFIVVQTHPPCAGCAQAGSGAWTAPTAPSPAGPEQPPAATAPRPAGAARPPAGAARPPAGAARPPAGAARPPAPPARTAGTGDVAGSPACTRERLAVRRLAGDRRRVRARVRATCLRPGHRYVLVVRRNRGGHVLASRTVDRAGAMTLRLRPASRARSLRFELRRDRRAVAARSLSLR
jgi:cysteine-rich secretory family protein